VISCQKTKYLSAADTLRETQLSQFYRYANISQHFYGPKNLGLVGDMCSLGEYICSGKADMNSHV
jgi:hypothetical protein